MTQEMREATRKAYSELRKLRPELRSREGQRLMIGRVAQAVMAGITKGAQAKGGRLVAVQAPTGSGKTLAYSVGAIPIALKAGKKVVISTATVSLQQQIVQRELPALAVASGGFTYGLSKGRCRFVCPVRLRAAQEKTEGSASGTIRGLAQKLAGGEWSGDRDALQEAVADEVWSLVTNDSDGCAGRGCSERSKCPYFTARDVLQSAQVIVTNHGMLISELLHEGGALPDVAETVFIVDEAHHLGEAAVGALSAGFGLREGVRWLGQARRAMGKASELCRDAEMKDCCQRGMDWLTVAGESVSRVASELDGWTEAESRETGVEFLIGAEMMQGAFGGDARVCLEQVSQGMGALGEVVSKLKAEDGGGLEGSTRELLLAEVGEAASWVGKMMDTWGLLCSQSHGEAPVARWAEVRVAERGVLTRLCASPTSGAQLLDERLWSKACAVVACSATLKGVGGFKDFLRESGMDRTSVVQTLEVESPFALAEQAKFVVPKVGACTKDGEAHTARLIELVPMALRSVRQGSGALMLFTSLKQMREVAAGMPDEVKEVLLVQGSASKHEILSEHAKAIGEGRSSVIFGSTSFEEGIDLPGRMCEMVLIAKLPFTVPTGAVEMVRRHALEKAGGNYFRQVAVPAACRRLAQEAGRLIRTESDRGAIVVFDERLTSTGYGREMLAALPPFTVENRMPGYVEVPW